VTLLLLDANLPSNSPADRGITNQFYDGDSTTRLLQELALGVGGWRALEELGLRPSVLHLNESHPSFAVVERARAYAVSRGCSFLNACWPLDAPFVRWQD
jgi:starch phosphorylase